MCVHSCTVTISADQFHIGFVIHVNNGKCVLVITEAQLPAGICSIRTAVNQTLCVMDVTISTKTTLKCRIKWILNIHHV